MTFTYAEIQYQVIAAIVEKLGEPDQQNTPLNETLKNLGADSIDILELILHFEEEFKVKLPEDDFPADITVQMMVNMVAKGLNIPIPQKNIGSKPIVPTRPVNTPLQKTLNDVKQNKR